MGEHIDVIVGEHTDGKSTGSFLAKHYLSITYFFVD